MNEIEMAVVKEKVDELEHMIKGNASPGIYRTVIETGQKVDGLTTKMRRFEGLLWTVAASIIIAAIIGGIRISGP
jgi:hypothetical protein